MRSDTGWPARENTPGEYVGHVTALLLRLGMALRLWETRSCLGTRVAVMGVHTEGWNVAQP